MRLDKCVSEIMHFASPRAVARRLSIISLLPTIIVTIAPGLGQSGEPPRIEGIVPTPLSSPSPIYPSGKQNVPSTIFTWGQTKNADTYVLWYEDGKGEAHIQSLSGTDIECSDKTLACETKSAIPVTEGMGKWAIRSVKGAESSPWSNTVFFGRAPEGSILDRCVVPEGSNVLTGDFNNVRMFEGEWSVGTAIQAQAIRYDFAKNQAGFNTGLGAGASFRYYKDVKGIPVSRIKQECRASTFRLKNENTLTAPLFSITPTVFASKLDDTSNLTVQPAIMFGFFEDILNIGVGFNLTGKPDEVGHVFLLMSLGMGFQF